MDILIKGMEIPTTMKCKAVINLSEECAYYHSDEMTIGEIKVCKAILIPDNGDLIKTAPVIDPVKDWKFSDKEKRIFLAAMGRELNICKEMDKKYPTREAYEDTLESVCKNIIRKVKGVLWTYLN